MREKAAARKQMEVKAMEAKAAPFASAAVSAPHNDTAVLAKSIVKQASAAVQAASSSAQAKQQPSKKSPEKAPVKSVKAAATPDALSALRPQLLSPMDTYEISDREGSDSESESESECEDDRAPRKKVRFNIVECCGEVQNITGTVILTFPGILSSTEDPCLGAKSQSHSCS